TSGGGSALGGSGGAATIGALSAGFGASTAWGAGVGGAAAFGGVSGGSVSGTISAWGASGAGFFAVAFFFALSEGLLSTGFFFFAGGFSAGALGAFGSLLCGSAAPARTGASSKSAARAKRSAGMAASCPEAAGEQVAP